MAKQVTEKYFRNVVSNKPNHYITKIQVNPFAFTATEADFFIQNKKYDMLVECKQVTLSNRTKKHFYVDRLTQESKLVEFENRFTRNRAFLFLVFWNYTQEKSFAYLIPIGAWIKFRKTNTRKTFDVDSAEENFVQYRTKCKGSSWNINFD